MNDLWQESWDCFVDLLNKHLRTNDVSSDLTSCICEKKITWEGLVEKVNLNALAPSIYINLPSRTIDFGDGRTAVVDGISLPVAAGSEASWANVHPGESIRFEAVIGPHESPFPPVTVKTFKSGNTIVLIRLYGGIPIKAA